MTRFVATAWPPGGLETFACGWLGDWPKRWAAHCMRSSSVYSEETERRDFDERHPLILEVLA